MTTTGTSSGKPADARSTPKAAGAKPPAGSRRSAVSRDRRVPLRSPLTAVLLAILFPGAGHWYQGRRFKATIFTVCIMTIFVWGMILGNWQPVYSQIALPVQEHGNVQMERTVPRTEYAFGFIAQVMMGGPVLPALVQQARFRTDPGAIDRLEEPLDSSFSGIVHLHEPDDGQMSGLVTGRLQLEPLNAAGGRAVRGELTGTLRDGSDVQLRLGGDNLRLGRKVFGSPHREIICSVLSPDGRNAVIGTVEGYVERSVVNWFMAPRDNEEMDRLHGQLNTQFDIASVFTWIAGLLNLLVIWDAADGPAYGYGDEDDDDADDVPE